MNRRLLNQNEYFVEQILDKKLEYGIEYYLVKWCYYPIEESTWEPAINLHKSQDLVDEFNLKFQKNHSPGIPFPQPARIIGMRICENDKIQYAVEWDTKENTGKTLKGIIDSNEISKFWPKIVIKYLESKICK